MNSQAGWVEINRDGRPTIVFEQISVAEPKRTVWHGYSKKGGFTPKKANCIPEAGARKSGKTG